MREGSGDSDEEDVRQPVVDVDVTLELGELLAFKPGRRVRPQLPSRSIAHASAACSDQPI